MSVMRNPGDRYLYQRKETAEQLRRRVEAELLDRLRAEAAMPEWYPER